VSAQAKTVWQTIGTHAARILNYIFHLLGTGFARRYLLRDYPPRQTVYHYFRLRRKSGWSKKINTRLCWLSRRRSGRAAQSSAGIIDSPNSKTVDTARGGARLTAVKRSKRDERHLLVFSAYSITVLLTNSTSLLRQSKKFDTFKQKKLRY